jgi:hypothetical protein
VVCPKCPMLRYVPYEVRLRSPLSPVYASVGILDVGNACTRNGAGRDALPLDRRQHVRWLYVRCTASDGRCTPARPAWRVWNAFVDP